MHNLFFHKLIDNQGNETEEIGCFNLNKVIRAVTYKPNHLMIILDDVHERIFEIPQTTAKGGKKTPRKERMTVQTEIYLTEEDSNKFKIAAKYTPEVKEKNLVEE